MIRTLALAAAALLGLAAPAMSQSAGPLTGQTRSLAPVSPPAAAATLPNTFDGPSAAPRIVDAPRAEAAQDEAIQAAVAQDAVTQADMAEGALRAVIADLAAGQLDEALFTPDLLGRLRPQLSTLRSVVAGFGALNAVEPQGLNNGASQFLAVFDEAATQWVIGLNAEGRIAVLLFRPVPLAASEEEDAEQADPPADDPSAD